MNPELQRNIWLNLTPWRLAGMPLVLGMVFFSTASLLPGDWLDTVAPVARWFYGAIVIVWGTWLAARAVVGEIRDRTWDGQRLSTLSPWTMLWGKLFGATIFVWYGGAICLAVIMLDALAKRGVDGMFLDFAYYVSIAVFAHAVTLLASLMAVRRRSGHPRLEVLFYQLIGLGAAWFASGLWEGIRAGEVAGELLWFGETLPAAQFFLWSLVAFMLWAIIGCWRQMRAELQMPGSPVLWLVFLGFMVLYAAGFGDAFAVLLGTPTALASGLTESPGLLAEPKLFYRLFLAFVMAALLTYVMAFAEPKDWVLYRRLAGDVKRGRLLGVLGGLQSWIYAFIVVVGLAVLMQVLGGGRIDFTLVPERSILPLFMPIPEFISGKTVTLIVDTTGLAFATAAFVARDLALVLFFNTGRNARRGDFAALITLFVLYAVLPGIFRAAGLLDLLPVLSPIWPVLEQTEPGSMRIAFDWDRVLWPLGQAALVWIALVARARASGKLAARQ